MIYPYQDTSRRGLPGPTGTKGNGIASIVKISQVGLVGTYRILYTNGTYFDFTIKDGETGTIGPQGIQGPQGGDGTGIVSIIRTSGTGAPGTTDTYTITYTDSSISTFQVTNGTNGTNGDDGADGISFIWRGTYSGATAYAPNDAVGYNGSSYMCKLASTGNLPTNATYWDLISQRGADGVGSGDMLKSENLSGLADYAVARTNLGLQDLATLDTVGTAQIDNDAVTFDKIQNIATGHFLGRNSSGSGNVEALSANQTKVELGLNNVDNTSDLNKPISTATQTALDAKVTGPVSTTDNSIARYDGTSGKVVQSSNVHILDNGSVGIGTDNPSDKLHVNGAIRVASGLNSGLKLVNGASTSHVFNDGNMHIESDTTPLWINQNSSSSTIIGAGNGAVNIGGGSGTLNINIPSKGAGKILTSDASGNATWETPAGSGFIGCKAIMTGTQYMIHNSYNLVAFGAEEFDTHTMHDNSTNNDRITITSGAGAGKYEITAHLSFADSYPSNNGDGQMISLYRNGTEIAYTTTTFKSTYNTMGVELTWIGDCSVNDYFQLYFVPTFYFSGHNITGTSKSYFVARKL